MRRRFLTVCAAIATLTLPLAACGGSADEAEGGAKGIGTSLDQVIAAAKEEGQLNLPDSIPADRMADVIAAFEEDYPFLSVTHIEQGGPDTLNQVQQETDAGVPTSADVFVGYPALLHSLAEQSDYLEQVDWKKLGIPDEILIDGNRQVAALTILTVLAYNTDLVAAQDVPRSWDALLDQRWRGQLVAFVAGWGASAADLAAEWGEDRAVQFTEGLKDGAQRVSQPPEVAPRVAAGEYPLGLMRIHHARAQIARGAPVDFTLLEPVPADLVAYAIPTAAPNKNAAALWVHWISQPENHALYEKAAGRGNAFLPGTQAARDVAGIKISTFDGPYDSEATSARTAQEDMFTELIR